MGNKKKYWGKTIASFVFVLFTMPLGHAMMRIMEETMSSTAVNVCAVIMGFVGLTMTIIGVFVKGDTNRTICLVHYFSGQVGWSLCLVISLPDLAFIMIL